MESLSDDQIIDGLTEVLRNSTGDACIRRPLRMTRTGWNSGNF